MYSRVPQYSKNMAKQKYLYINVPKALARVQSFYACLTNFRIANKKKQETLQGQFVQ